jgi:hypothetical protein
MPDIDHRDIDDRGVMMSRRYWKRAAFRTIGMRTYPFGLRVAIRDHSALRIRVLQLDGCRAYAATHTLDQHYRPQTLSAAVANRLVAQRDFGDNDVEKSIILSCADPRRYAACVSPTYASGFVVGLADGPLRSGWGRIHDSTVYGYGYTTPFGYAIAFIDTVDADTRTAVCHLLDEYTAKHRMIDILKQAVTTEPSRPH